MNRTLTLLIAAAATTFAGLNLASPLLRLDEAQPGQVDLRGNGVLAHVCDGGFGGAVKIDIQRVSDDEKYRIFIDPRVRTPGGVVLHQIPPGRYVATKLLLADRAPLPFPSDTFEVRAGEITSFGKVKVAPETNLIGQMKRLLIRTDSLDISKRLKAYPAFGVDSLPIVPRSIDWSIEPDKIEVGKGFST